MVETLVIGIDPSFGGLGLSDGTHHEVIKTSAGQHIDDRIDALLDGINRFIFTHRSSVPTKQMWCVEAPMLAPGPAGGSHLFEIGNLMRAIRSELAAEVRSQAVELVYLEVGIGALRHFTIGCGNAAKADLAYMVGRIHGVTFEKDAGMDKLVAWSLVQYGRAVLAGTHFHQFAAARGQGRDAKATTKRGARSRAAGAA